MALDGYCQNGKCKKPVVASLISGTSDVKGLDRKGNPIIEDRRLDLCAEDAAYFLLLRDEIKNPKRIADFINNCHRN